MTHLQHKRVPLYSRDGDATDCILITRYVVHGNTLNHIAASLQMFLFQIYLERYSEAWELHHRTTISISMSGDPNHTRSSVRRVSEPVCAICAATIGRVSRKEEYTKAKSSSDVTRNRSTVIRVASGNLCRTTLLSSQSVSKTPRGHVDLYCTPMAIAFAVGSAASITCVKLQMCRMSIFLCVGVAGGEHTGRQPRSRFR